MPDRERVTTRPLEAGTQTHLVLLGGGGHAAVVADAAHAAGLTIIGCLDAETDAAPPGVIWLGELTELEGLRAHSDEPLAIHAATGSAALRRSWLETIPTSQWATIVHPTAVVSPSAQLGRGVFVGPHAVINARAVIDDGVIVNTRVVIEHDCRVGVFAHIAPAAVLTGGVVVGPDVLVGAGAVVNPQMTIGSGATIGAGAVVVSDIPANARAVGVPARV